MKKLYRLKTKMITSDLFHSVYVVANHPTDAERMVIDYLEKNDYGFSRDRQVIEIELLAATDGQSNMCALFINMGDGK